jgi:hypothetical protein
VKGLIATSVFLAVLIYGGYTGLMALQYYLEISNLVDEVVQRELPKISGWGWRSPDRLRKIQEVLLNAANQSGIAIGPGDIVVGEQAGVLSVKVTYQYPVVNNEIARAITIPISTAHTYSVPEAR